MRLDLARASQGLVVPAPAGGEDHLLGVDLDALADHWLRGSDLVATYEPSDPRRLRATVTWRQHATAFEVPSWEVIVSAQTALLEAAVSVAVRSEVTKGTIRWSSGHSPASWQTFAADGPLPDEAIAVLIRRDATSRLIAVHPADARRIDVVEEEGRCRIDCRLFSAALEKGVLLRSRVLAAIGPSSTDEAWADRLLQAFADSPPPLST